MSKVIEYYKKILNGKLSDDTLSAFFESSTGSFVKLLKDSEIKESDMLTLQMLIQTVLFEDKHVHLDSGEDVQWQTSAQLEELLVTEDDKKMIEKFETSIQALSNMVDRQQDEQLRMSLKESAIPVANYLLQAIDPAGELYQFTAGVSDKETLKKEILEGKAEGKKAEEILLNIIAYKMHSVVNLKTIKMKQVERLERDVKFQNFAEIDSFMYQQ